MLLLTVSLFLCLILSTVGAGAQTSDDHGNTFASATPLSLGTSIAGRIDPGDDADAFKLDLSSRPGTTDVWIYTTGDLDTRGALYDVDPQNPFLTNDDSFITGRRYNFHLRATLPPGIYYVGVFSFDRITTGDYTLHAEAVTDPGGTISTATRLNLSIPTPGSIGTPNDADYFRLDLSKATHLYLYALSVDGELIAGYPVDTSDRFVHSNVHVEDGWFFIRDEFGPGTHYIKVQTLTSVTSHPVPYTIHAFEESAYPEFLEYCQAQTRALNDPQIGDSLYGCQWHLQNRSGEDINVEPVWTEGFKGEGVNIAVVDDGMDFNHEDLTDNVNTSLNHDYADIGSIFFPFAHHGTYVAGVIAARDNGLGVRGVAPRATIYGYNHLLDPTILSEIDAMTLNSALTAVSNNSWGHVEGPGLGHASSFWERAVDSGVGNGHGGKGVFYTWATGNGHQVGDNSNLDELANYYGVTAVCAVNDSDTRASYSEIGANIWVCAPSGESTIAENREVVTTENSDRYVYDFSGTSASTPIVSGVAALMRDANPNLTWRDLKLILATSARKNDTTNTGWEDGAQKYGVTSATDRYHFNHEYGFGVVDAKAAVDMAKGWTNAPPLKSRTATSGNLNATITDAPESGRLTAVTHNLSLNTDDINFIEFVEVNVAFRHRSFRDLKIELVSPAGTSSTLAVSFDTVNDNDPSTDFVPLNGTFRLGSARHLGEDPNGTWQLRVIDEIPVVSGIWDSWSITAYGHSSTPVDTSECATQGAVADAVQNPGLVSDCEALLEARDVLVGTGTSLNWSADTPISGWDGVTAEGTPARVAELSLGNMGLRGTLPIELGDLDGLKHLNLGTVLEVCEADVCRETGEHDHNSLTGAIPAALGSLAGLESLSISRNQVSGPLPEQLGNLSNLRLLALGDNQLSGAVPTWLGGLTSLEGLYLWGNEFSGPIPAELGNLSKLTQLGLGSNRLSGGIPNSLGNLTRLDRLNLQANRLTGSIPTQFTSLTSLEKLYLNDNQLTGQIPSWLGSLSNLEDLRLSQNQLTEQVPESLGQLTSLTTLSLWSNQLTGMIPASLVRLTSLEKLYLSQNQFTGCIPPALQSVQDNDLADITLPFCVSPTVSLSNASAGIPVRINSPISVTATFSEPVTGFTVADVSVANGSTSNFVGSDGDFVFNFNVTPNAIGVVTADVHADVATDAEGNGNSAAVQLSLGMPYDDDNDGGISSIEVLEAVRDYFSGLLTGQQILEIVRLYFSSPG